jgi:hypothetical protein
MTVLTIQSGSQPALFGREGELISLRIAVEPRLLEDLLEALAVLEFPVNPELYHHPTEVAVEFPAYSARINEVRAALRKGGFNADDLELSRVLARAVGI